jgi:hypothetical protein
VGESRLLERLTKAISPSGLSKWHIEPTLGTHISSLGELPGKQASPKCHQLKSIDMCLYVIARHSDTSMTALYNNSHLGDKVEAATALHWKPPIGMATEAQPTIYADPPVLVLSLAPRIPALSLAPIPVPQVGLSQAISDHDGLPKQAWQAFAPRSSKHLRNSSKAMCHCSKHLYQCRPSTISSRHQFTTSNSLGTGHTPAPAP